MSNQLLTIHVECYAGHRGEETPRVLVLGERRVQVSEVLDAWLAPDHRYFKVRGEDGDTYIIRHDVGSGTWEMTMFCVVAFFFGAFARPGARGVDTKDFVE